MGHSQSLSISFLDGDLGHSALTALGITGMHTSSPIAALIVLVSTVGRCLIL